MQHHNNYVHSRSERTIIASRSNPIVKAIRGLSSHKEREHSGLFFVDGLHLVAAATQQQAEIETCVVAPELLTSAFGRELARALAERGARMVDVTADVFHSLAAKEHAQGIGVVARQRWQDLRQIHPETGRCWVALDTVRYPGNLGTILRTCDAVGGAGVILLGDSTDPYDPSAVRASLGAIFSQRLARASFAEFAAWRQHLHLAVVGTSPAATLDYQAIAYQPPLILLMGSEARGLSREQQALCDFVVNIPMVGSSDSLNLAVATGIMLYEIFNQQRVARGKTG
ncbi:MAG TPA: RNA methyltransferase [Roseiflexaceae bacterium]|nr:RNA methyltransferase [Roseiflexaceae bacterium]